MVCPEEKEQFREAFKWLTKTVFHLEAVQNGRWAKYDIEAAVTRETQNLSTEELRQYRIDELAKEKEKAAEICVKRFNKLNSAYHKKAGVYILGFYENRDLLLKNTFIKLAKTSIM